LIHAPACPAEVKTEADMIGTVSKIVRTTTLGAALGLGSIAFAAGCSQPVAPSAGSSTVAVADGGAFGAAPSATTPTDLVARGWTCITPPTPNRIVCSHPNQGFPTPATPPDDRPASYSLWMFDGAGNFIGPYTLLRSDLYRGQPCDGTGQPWILRAPVGYYECVHETGR
jgi:hypothetical protein